MSFVDLPQDVIYSVLWMGDLSSVISIGQTNRYLHDLAFTPTVWISLVEDLRNRGFVDRLSGADLQTMSTESLVAVVKRLVVGPEAWSTPGIQSTPQRSMLSRKVPSPERQQAADLPKIQPCAQIVLHPAIPPALPDPALTTFKILRGGKYVLFCKVQDAPMLGCWRVADDALLGTYHSSLPTPKILDFEAEVFDSGERANIVMCVLAGTNNPGFIEIFSWDFATGGTELLSTTACTDYQLCSSPKICSGLAAVRVYQQFPWAEMYVIIDWHAQQYCKMLCRTDIGFEFGMQLIPGYFILTARPSSHNTPTEIRVVCFNARSVLNQLY
ncbi:hypothetical protein C8R44DRAFT_870634 [Mycena epipterygia]|nr:hypothetical protein C8R44DRAFT_870634 [Mycena epipterygia]